MTNGLWFPLACAAVAMLIVARDALSRKPSDFDNKEREEVLRVKQLRLSERMMKNRTHLLRGKHYRPVLTRSEPVTERPKLSAVKGGRR